MKIGPWELLILIPMFLVYFIPVLIVVLRRAKNTLGIVLVNVLAGWTFVGWLIALIWAIISPREIPVAVGNPSSYDERYCPRCGIKAPFSSNYCSNCGFKL